MDSKRYRRYFVILDNEDEGFNSKQGKKPKGYAKIETRNGKGILNYYVQNLKFFDKAEWVYRGYLIGIRKDKPIYVQTGMILIDKDGKGEHSWKFDVENVDGNGNKFNNFNVIAVIAEDSKKDKIQDITAPLIGFIDKQPVQWKHILKNYLLQSEKEKIPSSDVFQEKEQQDLKQLIEPGLQKKEKDEEEREEQSESNVQETSIEEKGQKVEELQQYEQAAKESNMEKEVPITVGTEKEEMQVAIDTEKEETQIATGIKKEQTETTVDTEKEEIQKVAGTEREEEQIEVDTEKEELEEPKKENDIEAEYMQKKQDIANYIEQGINDQDFKEEPEKIHYNSQYFRMVCEYIQDVLKYYPKVEPFENKMQGCSWWKIPYNNQMLYRHFMPFHGYINNMGYYPYTNYMTSYSDLIYKYQHYIFGISSDSKGEPVYYLYGVPGRFILSEQPDQGTTGFIYWHPIQDKNPERGDYGYWILHIDAKTGSVVMPLKPTLPPQY